MVKKRAAAGAGAGAGNARVAKKAFFLLLLVSCQSLCAMQAVLAAGPSSGGGNGTAASSAVTAEGRQEAAASLLAHFESLRARVAGVNGAMGNNPDPLLLASHLPFLDTTCGDEEKSTGKSSAASAATVDKMRTVGRALSETKVQVSAKRLLYSPPHHHSLVPISSFFLRETLEDQKKCKRKRKMMGK